MLAQFDLFVIWSEFGVEHVRAGCNPRRISSLSINFTSADENESRSELGTLCEFDYRETLSRGP